MRYESVDVTDAEQVRAAVRRAADAWDAPLTSVLHLAGAFHERPVRDVTPEDWRRLLDAKVRGAWTLHRVAAEHPVTSFVVFSSVNGFFGGSMNAAYPPPTPSWTPSPCTGGARACPGRAWRGACGASAA